MMGARPEILGVGALSAARLTPLPERRGRVSLWLCSLTAFLLHPRESFSMALAAGAHRTACWRVSAGATLKPEQPSLKRRAGRLRNERARAQCLPIRLSLRGAGAAATTRPASLNWSGGSLTKEAASWACWLEAPASRLETRAFLGLPSFFA